MEAKKYKSVAKRYDRLLALRNKIAAVRQHSGD